MRTEAFVNRLMVATREDNPDIKKIARMVEKTLSKVGSTPAGEEALRVVQKRMVKDALKRFAVLDTAPLAYESVAEPVEPIVQEPEKKLPEKSAKIEQDKKEIRTLTMKPLEQKKRRRVYRIEL